MGMVVMGVGSFGGSSYRSRGIGEWWLWGVLVIRGGDLRDGSYGGGGYVG